MNTIIYSQSLKDNGVADVWYMGKFLTKEDNIVLDDMFDERNKILDTSNTKKDKQPEIIEYGLYQDYLVILLYGDDVGIKGRKATIVIHSKYGEWASLLETLDSYLKQSGRHVSQEKKIAIKDVIQNAHTMYHEKQNLQIMKLTGVTGFAGFAIGTAIEIISRNETETFEWPSLILKGLSIGIIVGTIAAVGTYLVVNNRKDRNHNEKK